MNRRKGNIGTVFLKKNHVEPVVVFTPVALTDTCVSEDRAIIGTHSSRGSVWEEGRDFLIWQHCYEVCSGISDGDDGTTTLW